jgi:glycosyltransferase involved in cell wall biosynthesis
VGIPVSVIIPVWNGRAYLEATLRSVVGQTYPPGEVIVVDDGSTDGSGDLVRERFPQVKLVRQENRGVSATRNRGAAVAAHEYLAFCDADDIWLPWKLARQVATLETCSPDGEPIHVLASRALSVRDEETDALAQAMAGLHPPPPPRPSDLRKMTFAECLKATPVIPSTFIVSKRAFDETGGFDETIQAGEDWELWVRLSARWNIYVDPSRLCLYRLREGSLSTRSELMARTTAAVLRKWAGSPEARSMSEAEFRRLCSRHRLWNAYLSAVRGRRFPDEAFHGLPVDSWTVVPHGVALAIARRLPGPFGIACRLYRGYRVRRIRSRSRRLVGASRRLVGASRR